MALLATVLVTLGIGGLLWLDRDDAHVSKTIWVPFMWFLIASSRPISSWLSAPRSGSRHESYVEGSPLDRAILMALIALAVYTLAKRFDFTSAALRKNLPIVVFFVYCLISVAWADYPSVSFKRWIRGVADVAMVLVIASDQNPRSAMQWILRRVGYVLIPLSILFIRYYPELGRTYSMGGKAMWTGVCTDKNALGALCMLYGTGLLWSLKARYADRESRYRIRQLMAMVVVLLMVLYLISIVDSKTAMMCFAAACVVITFRRFFRSPTMVFSYVVGTVGICYAVLILGMAGSVLEAMGRDGSLTGRTAVWDAVLSFVESPVFGAGYENFWMGERLQALSRLGGNQAHNGYIEIYVNLGWVGLALLGLVVAKGFGSIVSRLGSDPDTGLKIAFFLTCLSYNFSEAGFKMMSPVWLMFLWATLATPARRSSAGGAGLLGVAARAPQLVRAGRPGARDRM